MKEIIKSIWDRYKQTTYIFCVLCTFMLCYTTFFLSISDTGFRTMMKSNFKLIIIFSVGSLLKEVIGAILEFRQKLKILRKKEK